MRYYLVAGERSGDLHGGNLINAIKKHDTEAIFRGFGGDHMKSAGMDLTVHYSDMAFMGFVEVLKNIGTLTGYIKKCKADIVSYKPDVVILIDYAGFNRRIATFARNNGIRVFYYITPKVWAWRQRRALQLKATVDRMFVILPFEKDFFKKYDWEVDYVGNPVLDAIKAHIPDPGFLKKHQLPSSGPLVALLPGSRSQEVQAMVPILTDVARRFPQYHFAVAAINSFNQDFYGSLSALPNVTLVYEDTYNLLMHARAAIVTSGTATLETALFKVPQAVVYKTSAFTYSIAKLLIRVPFISLVNLIADKEVIKELIQSKANAGEIGNELRALVADESYRSTILKDYDAVYKALDTGSASENTGRLMVKYLKERI